MAEEVERKFDIGRDAFGRKVTLRRYVNYQSKVAWEVVSHAQGQRDDTFKMDGLSDSNIEQIAEVLKLVKG